MALVTVPKNATVFLIEDNPERIKWFQDKLGTRLSDHTDSPSYAMRVFDTFSVHFHDLFFFDHDLGGAPYTPPFSIDVAYYLAARDPDIGKRVVIHSLNVPGVKNLQAIMPGSIWLPFGSFDIKIGE